MKKLINKIELSDIFIIGGALFILFVALSAVGNEPESQQLLNAIIK